MRLVEKVFANHSVCGACRLNGVVVAVVVVVVVVVVQLLQYSSAGVAKTSPKKIVGTIRDRN